MRMQWRLWRPAALALVLAVLMCATAAQVLATSVTPEGAAFEATNDGPVTFVTDGGSPQTIACDQVTLIDAVPNEETNPNADGSVLMPIPSTSSSYVGSFSSCQVGETPLGGGAGGAVTFAWNVMLSEDLVIIGLDPPAFTFNHSEGCVIVIGASGVQSIVGTWADGSPASTMTFTEQAITAEATRACGFGEFTRVYFEGVFDVETTEEEPVLVDGP